MSVQNFIKKIYKIEKKIYKMYIIIMNSWLESRLRNQCLIWLLWVLAKIRWEFFRRRRSREWIKKANIERFGKTWKVVPPSEKCKWDRHDDQLFEAFEKFKTEVKAALRHYPWQFVSSIFCNVIIFRHRSMFAIMNFLYHVRQRLRNWALPLRKISNNFRKSLVQ